MEQILITGAGAAIFGGLIWCLKWIDRKTGRITLKDLFK
jgi:hypothetical protein